jgi:hypothetical protein
MHLTFILHNEEVLCLLYTGHLAVVRYSSSSSSIGGAGGNPAYRTSAFEAVCTLTPVLVFPFISRGAPSQTA